MRNYSCATIARRLGLLLLEEGKAAYAAASEGLAKIVRSMRPLEVQGCQRHVAKFLRVSHASIGEVHERSCQTLLKFRIPIPIVIGIVCLENLPNVSKCLF